MSVFPTYFPSHNCRYKSEISIDRQTHARMHTFKRTKYTLFQCQRETSVTPPCMPHILIALTHTRTQHGNKCSVFVINWHDIKNKIAENSRCGNWVLCVMASFNISIRSLWVMRVYGNFHLVLLFDSQSCVSTPLVSLAKVKPKKVRISQMENKWPPKMLFTNRICAKTDNKRAKPSRDETHTEMDARRKRMGVIHRKCRLETYAPFGDCYTTYTRPLNLSHVFTI